MRAIGEGLDLAEVRGKLHEAKATVTTIETQLAGLTGTGGRALDHEKAGQA